MVDNDAQRSVDAENGLDGVLSWNLVRVSRLLGNRMAVQLAEHDLNPIHFGVLAFLAGAPEMTTADIARAVLIRPQSMTPLLDGLEERGLLLRTGARVRGRRNPVQITDAGRDALSTAWDVASATNDLRDVGLTATESCQLNTLLVKILHVSSDRPQPAPAFRAPVQSDL